MADIEFEDIYPAPELADEERQNLIKELSSKLRFSPDSGASVFLWLADKDRLRTWVQRAAATTGADKAAWTLFWVFFNGPSCTNALKTWCTRVRAGPLEDEAARTGPNKRRIEQQPFSATKIPKVAGENREQAFDTAVSGEPSSVNKPITTSSKRLGRSKIAKALCSQRDRQTCLITKARVIIENAHIYPYSLGSHAGEKNHASFWSTLQQFWSDDKITAWENAVMGQEGTESVQNLLCLTNHVHGLWARAYFALKPLELSDDKKTLMVKFFWLQPSRYSRMASLSVPPVLPGGLEGLESNQAKLWNAPREEKICSGDVLEFVTDDPWTLNRLVAMSGAAEVDDSEMEDDEDFPPAADWWEAYEGVEEADYQIPKHKSFSQAMADVGQQKPSSTASKASTTDTPSRIPTPTAKKAKGKAADVTPRIEQRKLVLQPPVPQVGENAPQYRRSTPLKGKTKEKSAPQEATESEPLVFRQRPTNFR